MGTSKYSVRHNDVSKTHLYTKGKEYSLNGVEYVGQYHMQDDSAWTEPLKSDQSQELQKYYINSSHYTNDKIKNFKTPPLIYKEPIPIVYRPSQQAYTAGQDTRFFVEKINDETSYAIEIDQQQFNYIGRSGGIDNNLYTSTSIVWKLLGVKDEIADFNQVQIQKAKRVVPTIDYAIPNLTQFAILK